MGESVFSVQVLGRIIPRCSSLQYPSSGLNNYWLSFISSRTRPLPLARRYSCSGLTTTPITVLSLLTRVRFSNCIVTTCTPKLVQVLLQFARFGNTQWPPAEVIPEHDGRGHRMT